MLTSSTLSPTARFWLDSLDLFDPRQDGPHWEQPMADLIEHTVRGRLDIADLVREAIVIQQFLLELLTRSELDRGCVITQVGRLLKATASP